MVSLWMIYLLNMMMFRSKLPEHILNGHPFNGSFGVHQVTRVLTHNGNIGLKCLEMIHLKIGWFGGA